MSKIWNKGDSPALNSVIEQYTVGDDTVLDQQLLIYDIVASQAHAKGLGKIGILSDDECKKIDDAFEILAQLVHDDKFEIKLEDEDCHTAIENYLVEKLGDTGKKIHSGRSRNDQVLVALRLYMLSHIDLIHVKVNELANTLVTAIEKYQDVPLPGYSHTQQAMMSSVGHLFSAYLESLLDDIDMMQMVAEYVDKNPLGSAAGYGVSLALDRQLTTEIMGLNSVQVNSLYCQNSKGKFEGFYLEGLLQIMMTLGRLASDLILFSSQEFDFFEIDASLTTGSSIMPQKKNLDGLEILRAHVNVVSSNHQLVHSIPQGLISGYHRDTQLLKKPLMESTFTVLQSLEVAKLYIAGATPKEEEIKGKISQGIYAADVANKLVQEEGLPFREAYQKAMEKLESEKISPEENIKSKISLGAPGNLGLDILKERVKTLNDTVESLMKMGEE
jgi:argininosuccinate lyase